MNSYQHIGNYLSYVRDKYNLHICIKDFCGFIPINPQLDEVLRPFLAHTNPFCMYVKCDQDKYRVCLTMIKKMHNKCLKSCEPFYGMCHAGLGEYVIPIVLKDVVLGSLNLGFFQTNERRTAYCIERACRGSELIDAATAQKLYNENIVTSCAEIDEVMLIMKMLAEYLAHTYASMQATHHNVMQKRHYNSSEDTIISHAIEHIETNCTQKIMVSDIAEICHCSETYLSRVFKKRIGVSLVIYINKVRVEHSKNHLLLTDKTISDIALESGFEDPNYFSRVFAEIIGIPPTEFRRRFREESAPGRQAMSADKGVSVAD